MAAPTFVAASTGSTDAGGAWTATGAAGTSGNIVILQVLQDGSTSGAVTLTSATNIEDLAGTDNQWTSIGAFAHGSTHIQHLWIGRLINTSAPTASGGNTTSEDLYWRFYEFSSVNTGTTLAAVIEQNGTTTPSTTSGTDGTVQDAGVTTTGPDRLFLNFVSLNDDNAHSPFQGQTASTWWHVGNGEYAEASGTDGAISLNQAELNADLFSIPSGIASSGSTFFGQTTGYGQWAQTFICPATATTSTVSAWLAKSGSPSDNAVIAIQADSTGSPSGTDLGTGTISGSTLTTSATQYDISITASLTAGTKYWIIARRSGALNDTDYYTLGACASLMTVSPPNTSPYRYDTVWNAETSPLRFLLKSTTYSTSVGTIDGGTATNPDATDGWGVVGFALIGTTKSSLLRPHRYHLIRR